MHFLRLCNCPKPFQQSQKGEIWKLFKDKSAPKVPKVNVAPCLSGYWPRNADRSSSSLSKCELVLWLYTVLAKFVGGDVGGGPTELFCCLSNNTSFEKYLEIVLLQPYSWTLLCFPLLRLVWWTVDAVPQCPVGNQTLLPMLWSLTEASPKVTALSQLHRSKKGLTSTEKWSRMESCVCSPVAGTD